MSALSILPPAARVKLTAIEGSAADAEALTLAATSRIDQLEKTLAALSRQANAADGKSATLDVELAATAGELKRMQAVQASRQARRSNDVMIAASIRAWLEALPERTVLEVVPVPAATLQEGENLSAAIERVRRDINSLSRELTAVLQAPEPMDDLRARARQYVTKLAARGRPRIATARGEFAVAWRTRDAGTPGMTPEDAAAFAAWLDPERLAERLVAEVDRLPQAPGAISADERARRSGELETLISKAERAEEALIEAALASGQDVARRPRASPLAILGLRIVNRKEARAA